MTAVEMSSWFDIVQDKYNTPYYTDEEKSQFINRAQDSFVFEVLFGDGENPQPTLSQRISQKELDTVRTILEAGKSVSVTAGLASISDIETAIGGQLYHLLAVNDGNRDVEIVRHSSFERRQLNEFLENDGSNPYAVVSSDGIKVNDSISSIFVTAIRKPVSIDISTPVNCELPDFTHVKIMARAMEMAGVGSRDEFLSGVNVG